MSSSDEVFVEDGSADGLAGPGITWLPSILLAQHLRESRLVERPLGKLRCGVDVYAVWPQMGHVPSKLRVAIDDLAARTPHILAAAQPEC